jgi:hypothetical protein
MSLFPYRYAAAQEASKTGMPMMRTLVLLHQNDDGARTAKDEYMFGPDFLGSGGGREYAARGVSARGENGWITGRSKFTRPEGSGTW